MREKERERKTERQVNEGVVGGVLVEEQYVR